VDSYFLSLLDRLGSLNSINIFQPLLNIFEEL
ncbi:unnamed protein product, partial [marine sediment metagenome]